MIGRGHALCVTKQAQAAGLARSTVYYPAAPGGPQPISNSCARSTSCIWSFPYAGRGCCAVSWLPNGSKTGRRHVKDADAADGHRGAVPSSAHDEAGPGTKNLPVSAARAWRSRGRTRSGRWTSRISPWRRASSISPRSSTGSRGACCRGGYPSRWRRRSASRRWRTHWRSTVSLRFFNNRSRLAVHRHGLHRRARQHGIAISMDGKRRLRDNVFRPNGCGAA